MSKLWWHSPIDYQQRVMSCDITHPLCFLPASAYIWLKFHMKIFYSDVKKTQGIKSDLHIFPPEETRELHPLVLALAKHIWTSVGSAKSKMAKQGSVVSSQIRSVCLGLAKSYTGRPSFIVFNHLWFNIFLSSWTAKCAKCGTIAFYFMEVVNL